MKRTAHIREAGKVAGYLTITSMKDGEFLRHIGRFPNKVVSSAGHGRNLIARQLAADVTYPLAIDNASVGDSNTAATDAQTDLISPLVTDLPITNASAVDDVLTVDVFVPDANLPDDTYQELGLFCGNQLFARVVISPAYTKVAGEDTLFTYELALT